MKETNTLSADLINLEQRLKSKLHPIQPDKKFIGALRNQLEQASVQSQERRLAASFLTVAGGLMMGLIIYLIGRRYMNQED